MSRDEELFGFNVPFDPLDVKDEDDEDVEFIGLVERPDEDEGEVLSEPQLSPEESIQKLLESLPAQRKVLLAIVDFCREERSPGEVDEVTLELQKTNKSVYTPVLLRQMLEEAGALVYNEAVQPDEQEAGIEPEPEVEQVEGEEIQYLVVAKRPEGTWLSTAAALTIVDAEDPALRLRELLGVEPEYFGIFTHILDFCVEKPRTKQELNELVDDDPLLQQPRRYSGFFIDKLDGCSALAWKPGWQTTQIGIDLLAQLAETQSGVSSVKGGAPA
ncbi:MAG: hypothetical protein LBS98_06570 [Coriobacteriales bacterium]|jgi:hypothetical protein|nr:hypothetical protein [Coriobacteriales bacterium]